MGHASAATFGGPGFWIHRAREPRGALPLSPHFHDEYLLCAQLRGDEECRVGRRLHHLRAGDLILINPEEVHTGHDGPREGLEYLSLYVDRERVARAAAELGGHGAPEFVSVKVGGQASMIGALEELWAAMAPAGAGADPIHALDLDVAVTRVVGEALTAYSNLREPRRRPPSRVHHRRIARALELLRAPESCLTPPSLAALADAAGLSKFHFLRTFDAEVGMTPGAYLRTLRICRAARALGRGSQTPREVATEVGFRNLTSFGRAFKAIVGLPPLAYQRLRAGSVSPT